MTIGPLVAALGVALLTRVDAHVNYLTDVLLSTSVFGAGLTLMVTPLTATVLAAAPTKWSALRAESTTRSPVRAVCSRWRQFPS